MHLVKVFLKSSLNLKRDILMNKYTLSVTTENALRVLQRIATVFSRHRINIEKLHVDSIPESTHSEFSLDFYTNAHLAEKLTTQLARIIEVIDISVFSATDN